MPDIFAAIEDAKCQIRLAFGNSEMDRESFRIDKNMLKKKDYCSND
jgi:hypothetical protein